MVDDKAQREESAKRKAAEDLGKRNELMQILMGSKQSGGVKKYSELPQSVGQGDRYKTYQSDGRHGEALIHGQKTGIVIGGMGVISWIKKEFVQVINAAMHGKVTKSETGGSLWYSGGGIVVLWVYGIHHIMACQTRLLLIL